MKNILIGFSVFINACITLCWAGVACAEELKPRLVVMTDIGPADVEPDDNESAVRLLSYADRFEIEMICTTIGWNCDPYPAEWADFLNRVVDDYAIDVHNLMKRSGQQDFKPFEEEKRIHQELGYWPSVDYLRSCVCYGSSRAGIGVIGEGNDSEGSNRLIQLALEDDPRPIWVTSWGGSNTLAQAIWRYSQTASSEQLKAFVQKFRIYTITDQDMQWSMRMQRDYSSHMWMRQAFVGDLKFIWDESAWLNQNELGKQNWNKYASLIQGKGAMGKHYPTFKWGVEGDTPSFLHLMPNGLNDPDEPMQVGWGGYHVWGMSPDSVSLSWTNWQHQVKEISDAYEKRFYPDEFNDFAARMAWADEGKGNHNPVVVVNNSKSVSPLVIEAKAGSKLLLDAAKSFDPDGDHLEYYWWQQPEVGTYVGKIRISDSKSSQIQVELPADAAGREFHLVCEVRDNGPFQLVSYRRVIVKLR
ncbi:MAG: DUF1593 domain-containing protein [Bacteroidales bacterium]|nr:DUF1593 domain-containing protein [Bacteroidales bacterium]